MLLLLVESAENTMNIEQLWTDLTVLYASGIISIYERMEYSNLRGIHYLVQNMLKKRYGGLRIIPT